MFTKSPAAFVAVGLLGLSVLVSVAEAQTLFWAEESGIFRQLPTSPTVEAVILKEPVPNARGVAVDPLAKKLYWTTFTPRSIVRSNLDGSHVETLIEFASNPPFGIALDTLNGKMYWARSFLTVPGRIQRANLDGTDVEDLVVADAPAPAGIALDVAGGKMYWTDWSLDVVRRANLDGSAVETIISGGLTVPRDLALDLEHGKVYWTNYSGSQLVASKIERANLDGTDRETIQTATGTSPAGIVIDSAAGKVFWMDDRSPDKSVRASNLDGSEPEAWVDDLGGSVWGIDLDPVEKRLYWVNHGDLTIFSASLESRESVRLFSNIIWNPISLALDRAANQFYWVDLPGDVRKSSAAGEIVTPITGLTTSCGILIENSSRRVYYVDTSAGASLRRAVLNGSQIEHVEVMYPLPFLAAIQHACGTMAVDLLRGHVYHSFVEYPFFGKIRRAGLDGSNPVDVVEETTPMAAVGGPAVDVLNERLYWWSRTWDATDGFTDFLLRAKTDGSEMEILDEFGFSDSNVTLPSVVVAPWEQAVYYAHPTAPSIYRLDLSDMSVDAAAQASAVGLDIDACPPDERAQAANWGTLFTDCLHGPAAPLPTGCACADLTGEGLIDLRDVSAFMLSVGQ